MYDSYSLDGSTSKSLLDGLRNESAEAWTVVATVYAPLIARWARKYLSNESDVMDVCQNSLLAVMKYATSFKKERQNDSFRRWLYVVTRNEALKFKQAFSNDPHAETVAFDEKHDEVLVEDDDEDVDSDAVLTELQRQALRVVKNSVNPKTWDIYWDAIRGDLPTEMIAERHSTTACNVRVIKLRLTNRIREMINMSESA